MLPEVIIESYIPFVGDTLEGIARVCRLSPEEIDAGAVRDADALIVRTRTRCDATLLSGSRVRFVATATIGTDHLDLPYLKANGIEAVSCPGCNAPAVAQYVWSSIFTLLPDITPDATIGIVGLGHVGSIVARWGHQLGFNILACDPPRGTTSSGYDPQSPANEGSAPFVSLDKIARRADVITLHTPHTRGGNHPTHHLAGPALFDALERKPLLINAARGPVVDTPALIEALRSGKIGACAIDCWEGEPAIDRELLHLSAIATPHIAGYSIQGKERATAMSLAALLRFIASIRPDLSEEANRRISALQMPPAIPPGLDLSRELILNSYDPLADTRSLRQAPADFEALRNHYNLRTETGF